MHNTVMTKNRKSIPSIDLPKKLRKNAGKAIIDFGMIREGDKVLLGLSGGKDSLSLLHLLLHFQRHAPIKFDVGAMTVDPQSGEYDPSPLIPYLKEVGVEYFFKQEPILEMADDHMTGDSYCSFCSRIKRGIIYSTAREYGYNVIALGQHLDDLAESFLMSAFHGGKLKTMKAHYVNDDGDLRIIRPLVYVREKELASFAKEQELPVIMENCPACFSMPTQRESMKQLLAQQEQQVDNLFGTLLTTMKPLMSVGLPKE
ncbi:ATP-binding protein [uncultured Cocleimonas sp.]|uniref:ATP-binding protein n=1 Tax=uncultured Cocleimonas sp. TaxID=1051587 RepID=UPI0026399DDA|nr:ATP-binding protein [uncultured Cocleimonas sp.]